MIHEGCKGYYDRTCDGMEFNCEYEYSGYVDCDKCIFGGLGGTEDPRLPPSEEDGETVVLDTTVDRKVDTSDYGEHADVLEEEEE